MFACLFFIGGKYHVTVIAGWGRLAVQERAKLLKWGAVCHGGGSLVISLHSSSTLGLSGLWLSRASM